MIHVVDKASIGSLHVMYNASILNVLRMVFPDDKITFYAETTHLEYVKKKAVLPEIEYVPISIISSKTANPVKRIIQLLRKINDDRTFFKKLLRHTEQNNSDIIFLCTAATLSFLLFKKLKTKYTTSVIATLHGEVEHIYYAKDKREKSIGSFYKQIFKIQAPNFYYVLLNKIAKKSLVQDGYLKEAEVIEIDHPYLFDNGRHNTTPNTHSHLRIGHVGSLGVRKNAHLIYQLAYSLKEQIQENKLTIYSIGPIEPNVLPYRNDWVADGFDPATDNAQYLSREAFEKKIEQLDYALFFYNEEQFVYRASGAIFDVITYNKPIIVLRHPYFEYLFAEAGNIGFMCDTLEDIRELVIKLYNQNNNSQYAEQIINIQNYQLKLSIENIAKDFKIQLKRMTYA